MKIKIFILFICIALFSSFTNALLTQETENEGNVTGKIRGQHKVEQHNMMDLQKMSATMDSCSIKCTRMMEQMKQTDAQGVIGEQVGLDAMMGTAQSLKEMADQLKMINQHLNKMMASKEIMNNKVPAQKMKEMRLMIVQTNKNLNQMATLTQQMMGTMHKKID